MTDKVDIAPEVIQWALSKTDWDLFDTPRIVEDARQWAAGSKKPTMSQVMEFAEAANVPFGFLFMQKPPADRCPIPDMRTPKNPTT